MAGMKNLILSTVALSLLGCSAENGKEKFQERLYFKLRELSPGWRDVKLSAYKPDEKLLVVDATHSGCQIACNYKWGSDTGKVWVRRNKKMAFVAFEKANLTNSDDDVSDKYERTELQTLATDFYMAVRWASRN